jgi:peptidoglycan/xylan/chitin deacetylase (PgdA/CDA1 family)
MAALGCRFPGRGELLLSHLFFRFDDIGESNRNAFRFIDLMETLERPYVLGVIPQALGWWMKRRLRALRHAVIYQHGTMHRNRLTKEAPDEFPSELGRTRIASELRRGRQSMENALGIAVTGYVPPWNSVSEVALRVLEEANYRVLSADAIHSTSLRQIPVHVDVYSRYRPVTVRPNPEIESDISVNLQKEPLVGVMLHPMSVPRENMSQLQDLIRSQTAHVISGLQWKEIR